MVVLHFARQETPLEDLFLDDLLVLLHVTQLGHRVPVVRHLVVQLLVGGRLVVLDVVIHVGVHVQEFLGGDIFVAGWRGRGLLCLRLGLLLLLALAGHLSDGYAVGSVCMWKSVVN